MFSDEASDSVTVASVWRKQHESQRDTTGSQTSAVLRCEAEVQTGSRTSSSTQTEPEPLLAQLDPEAADPPGLRDFLQRVEEEVVAELLSNARSHAFDGHTVNWGDRSQLVSCLHLLQHPAAQERGLHVTCVSWSCTGSVVACGFGRMDAEGWSSESSYVCTWNLDRRGLDPQQADLVLDVPTAVTALCCHPDRPALMAGGLYSGEVVVWDTSRTQDPVLALTGSSAESHREPVYQVSWVPLQRRGGFGVLSASSGGRVLLWTLDSDQGRLVLDAAFAFVRQQLPQGVSVKPRGGGSSTVGVTSLALSPWDPDTFLVGSEGGLLLRCSFSSTRPAAVASEGQSVTPRAPAVFSFRPSSGPVHSIHCSPFHRNLFVSAGTDGLAHVHSLLQVEPLLSLRVSDSYVFQVQWSPSRPLVFAAATGQGKLQIFDLSRRSLRAAATIEQGGAAHAATSLSFNAHNPPLLAVGCTDGTLGVWQLSADLSEQRPRESGQLEQIANQVAE